MSLEVIRQRGSLPHTRAAIKSGTVTVGFIGGSITESKDFYRSYSDHVINALTAAFPDTRVIYQNAGIGATTSALGAFRVKPEIIDNRCDLVFVEYAVNDHGETTELRMQTREGLLRQLMAAGNCDIVLVYTFDQGMYQKMMDGIVPNTVAEFEQLAEHYNISSVWMGLHALNKVREGVLRWEEWLPDGLHPEVAGSRYYAEPVIDFVVSEINSDRTDTYTLREPLSANGWERVHTVPLESLSWKSPWKLRRMDYRSGRESFLDTSAVGATLTIPFEGTGLFLGCITGSCSAYFDYRIDGGEWQESTFGFADWMLENIWYRGVVMAKDLPRGSHTFELRTKHSCNPAARGTRTDICLVGVFE